MSRIVSISSLKGGVGKTSITPGGSPPRRYTAAFPHSLLILDPHGDASTGLAVDESIPDVASPDCQHQ